MTRRTRFGEDLAFDLPGYDLEKIQRRETMRMKMKTEKKMVEKCD